MALINCPECDKEISDKVKNCPHCGYPLIDDTPQKVEVTGVNIKDNSKRKIVIGLAVIAVLALITYGIITLINIKRAKDYSENINSTVVMMLANASKCESMCGIISTTWRNAIFDDYDEYNKGYLDFNSALQNLLADSDIKTEIESIKKVDVTIAESVKSLQNPPSEFKELYNDMLELYGDYQGLVSQATNPSGSLQSYNSDVNNKISEFMKNYNKIKAKLPNK